MSNPSLFRRFLCNPTRVGAVCPSSPMLCRAITSGIGLERAGTVVELGPGTGAITREIVRRLSRDAHFVAVELDGKLCAELRRMFPEYDFCNDSASRLPEILRGETLPPADIIISGLPWAIFPESLQLEILNGVVRSLAPGGCFTTFAYLQGLLLPAGRRFRQRLLDFFPEVETTPVVWRNLPPAFAYRCRKS